MSFHRHRLFQHCSYCNHSHELPQRMSLSVQEVEEEMMQTAVAMSNSVLNQEDEMMQTAVAMSNSLNVSEGLQRLHELDLELVMALRADEQLDQRLEGLLSSTQAIRSATAQQPNHSAMAQQSNRSAMAQQPNRSAMAQQPNHLAMAQWNNHAIERFGGIPVNYLNTNAINIMASNVIINAVLPRSRSGVLTMELCLEPPSPGQTNEAASTYFGLHEIYWNYRYVPVKFLDEFQWPAPAVYNQLKELRIPRGNEDIVEWQEGQSENDRCIICLTNVATRVAVPCGHKLSCRACIASVITTTKSNKRYLYRAPNGEFVPTRYEIPVRCLICRCIVGMIIVSR